MNYKIKEEKAFSILMQEIALTEHKRQNIERSIQFWKTFNKTLRLSKLSQSNNWTKYAFMRRQDGQLFYGCALPYKNSIPDCFQHIQIKAQTYIVFEHMGAMNTIYETYDKIYKEMIPTIPFKLSQKEFLHFEKYDYRFHWNKDTSIIEIWIPIINKNNLCQF